MTHDGEDAFSGEASSGDSFLREVLQVEPPSRLPDSGAWLGGPEGRRFQLLEPMGRGGMGQVFRARDATLGREVALKFLFPRPGFEELALAEARAVARVDHENIVRIFDVAEWSSGTGGPRVPFLVMECLEGESLAGLLKRERPELRRALELLEAIAAGLAHAHERGIVHRDLKPGNVFLTRQGAVKLLDFGLSHLTVEPVCSARPSTGGSPGYMAPEQWRGEAQDARTDLWAVGVVLYELLTGELPFQGATLAELRERVTSEEPAPPVRGRHPEIPGQVEALVATLLAKEPARRFSSALELREELHELRGRLFGTGREVPDATTEPQRRQVTVVSCQLSGLAEGGAPLDAEDLGELELAFHAACVEIIERHGGSVALSMAGEVLACFGWAQGHEDDSERAVHAGLQLTQQLPEVLQRRLPHLPLSRLSVRGGVHSEWMAVGPRLQGEAPKVAAWLAGRAGPGGLAVSDRTWTLVRRSFLGEPMGSESFAGLSGSVPLAAHRVSREREADSRFARARLAGRLSPLVGRERELEELLALWRRARRGQGAFVLVSGEAGIGKSRLIEALCERAAQPVQLIRMQCWSRFSTQALHPILELLRTLVAAGPEQPPPERLRRLEAWGHSQEDTHLLALLLALPIPEDSPVLQLTPERRREKTFEALVRLLQRQCDDAPVLLVIEDLHWADSNLLAFLGLLLERSVSSRLLVVLSARPEFQPDWPWGDRLHRLGLERLPAGLAAVLVREVAQGHGVTEEAVRLLVEKTDGIPLFIEEMTRMVLEGGAAASIPLTLHELLLARLDMLPSQQRSLAQLGAVVGREFSYALLSAVAERDEARLGRELAGLMEAGLLRQREGAEGPVYEFRHALLQDAAYQSLSRSARRRLHGRIARVLTERFPSLVEVRPEALAYHLTEAGERAAAIGHWERAGVLALERQAAPEALGHVTRALALWQGLPEAGPRPHEELRLRLFQGMAMTQSQGFSTPQVVGVHARVFELIRQVGEELPRWELLLWEPFLFYYARAEFRQVEELAERLLDLGQRHAHRGLTLLGRRAMTSALLSSGRPREAMARWEHVLASSAELTLEEHRGLAVAQGVEPRVAAWAHGAVGHAVQGRMDASRQWAREALALARRVGHPYTTVFMQVYVSLAHVLRGEAQEALALAEQSLALFGERSVIVGGGWAAIIRACAVSELGRPQEGLALLRRAMERWRMFGIRVGAPFNLGMLALIHLKLGQLREAQVAVEKGLLEGAESGEHIVDALLHQLRGECLRRQGREPEARRCFLRALAIARKQGAGLFELRAMVSLCRQLGEMGRTRDAWHLLSRTLARFEVGGESVHLQEARALLAGLQASRQQVAPEEFPATS